MELRLGFVLLEHILELTLDGRGVDQEEELLLPLLRACVVGAEGGVEDRLGLVRVRVRLSLVRVRVRVRASLVRARARARVRLSIGLQEEEEEVGY